jgi:hypothetical protein
MIMAKMQAYNGSNVTAMPQGRAITYVPSEDGYTTMSTQTGDTVYVRNSRDGTYKHVLHRVSAIVGDRAVMHCQVWAHGGTVMPLEKDCAVWCQRGCKPAL